jgi:hypothetical protein
MRAQDPAAADVIVVAAELADGLACPSFIRESGRNLRGQKNVSST